MEPIELTPKNSGAVVSIAIEKDGPLSTFMGHNLILRVGQFVLRAASKVPSLDALMQEAVDGNWGWTKDDARLAQCCHAVAGATMKTKTITVHGGASKLFLKPKVTAGTDGDFDGDTAQDTKREVFPALFRWPCNAMAEADVGQIEQNIWGSRGRLGTRQDYQSGYKPGSTIHDIGGFHEIDFFRDWSSADWVQSMDGIRNKPPFQIAGGLRIHGRRLPIYCNAFLTSSRFGGPHMAAMAARGNTEETDSSSSPSSSDIVVFQCPLRSSRWNLEPMSIAFGALSTKDDVLVEVAVPVNDLLSKYPK